MLLPQFTKLEMKMFTQGVLILGSPYNPLVLASLRGQRTLVD
jgi:hypothetical protein